MPEYIQKEVTTTALLGELDEFMGGVKPFSDLLIKYEEIHEDLRGGASEKAALTRFFGWFRKFNYNEMIMKSRVLRSIVMLVAGVDEVGRGTLAGGVFASAVILNLSKPLAD